LLNLLPALKRFLSNYFAHRQFEIVVAKHSDVSLNVKVPKEACRSTSRDEQHDGDARDGRRAGDGVLQARGFKQKLRAVYPAVRLAAMLLKVATSCARDRNAIAGEIYWSKKRCS